MRVDSRANSIAGGVGRTVGGRASGIAPVCHNLSGCSRFVHVAGACAELLGSVADYGMRLSRIRIANFRGIKHLTLELDPITVLIGENNTGKSSILAALQGCLGRPFARRGSHFGDYDHYLPDSNVQPASTGPAEICLEFRESEEGEWPDEVLQLLAGAAQVDEDDKQSITLRVISKYDADVRDFVASYDFLNPKGQPLPSAQQSRHLQGLQGLVPLFYLAALRDAAAEFRPRSPFWAPFVRSLTLDDNAREELERDLTALNERLLGAHDAFNVVKERMRAAGNVVRLGAGDPVAIEPLPAKIFDMLSRTQVTLAGRTGARLPLVHHGEGTQSLAVICLFDAFLAAQLDAKHGPHVDPLLALEEPEAHLHPSAIRAVASILKQMRGQKVITTHSGDLAAAVPLTSIRRLRRTAGSITVHRVKPGTLTDEELRKIDHHVRLYRGNLLFSRFWLLVEGETDTVVFNEAARIMGHDLFCEGVCCVEYATVGADKFIKLADQLGIDWLLVADRDQAGDGYVRSAEALLHGRPVANQVRQLDHGTMEVFLCMEGYGAIYEANISPQKRPTITASNGSLEYWKQVVKAQADKGKPRVVLDAMLEMEARGDSSMPMLLKDVIQEALRRSDDTA